MIADERRRMADLLDRLTDEQLGRQSLCAAWTVHQVAAHLTTYLRFGQLKMYVGMTLTAGDFDPFNEALAARDARRSTAQISSLLRRRAESRTTIPGSGYDPVLTDLVLHDLDVRLPLGIHRRIEPERLWVAFNHLTTVPALGFGIGSRLDGLRLEASDAGWVRGVGAPVRGRAQDLLLGVSGRAIALDALSGSGVDLLRERLNAEPEAPARRRTAKVARLMVSPSDHRSRLVGPRRAVHGPLVPAGLRTGLCPEESQGVATMKYP